MPSDSRKLASAGRIARNEPSSTFSATASPSAEHAQKSPSAPPFATQPGSAANELDIGRDGAAQQLRMGAHGGDDARRLRRAGAAAPNSCAQRSSVNANVGTPQPSTATGTSAGGTPAVVGDLHEQLLLQRMPAEAVAARLEPARPADGEEARVLAEQLCSIGVGAGPVSSSSSVAGAAASSDRTASSCSGSAMCDAHAIAISRSSTSGRARTSGSA